jgi:hypothetical protein
MSRFKILVFLLTLGIAGSIIATAYWFYKNVLGHDDVIATEIKAIQGNKAALPDPGIRRFNDAVELIAEGKLIEGRNALYALVSTFPDSNRVTEAKRIIGEINMDMMFSVDANPEKKKYTVQPGQGLSIIATKHQTTIECLMRANGLFNDRLHPGDHLYVFPLDFEIVVDVSAKTVTLLRKYGEKGDKKLLFKEYLAADVRLPSFVRAPTEMVIASRPGGADKWLVGNKSGSTTGGINIRAVPQAKAVSPDGSGNTDDPALANVPEPGVFLQREDIEELYSIIRPGTPLTITR